jgi:hypothetical protein
MSVRKGFAFESDPLCACSSGDGAAYPSHINPITGTPDPAWTGPAPVAGMLSTAGALDTEISRSHGDVAAFKSAQAQATGEKGQGSQGFVLVGETDHGFQTHGYDGSDNGSDTSGYGRGLGYKSPMVVGNYSHQGESGDSGSDTSGYGKVL